MLVSQPIPGMYNGVSQQPASLRLSTQCEDQVNAFGTLVDGLYKRPPTEWIANLVSNAASGAFVHEINRDMNERYIMVITDNALEPIEIFKLDGTKCTVRYGILDENLNFTANAFVKDYITTKWGGDTPQSRLKAVTVADYTILVNMRVYCGIDWYEVIETQVNEAFVWVKTSALGTTYRVSVAGYVGQHTTSTTDSESTTYIAGMVRNALLAHQEISSNYSIEERGSVLRITKNDGGDFDFSVWDGYGDQGMIGIKGRVNKYNDLPPHCWNNTRIEVHQADEKDFTSSYYVQFDSDDGNSGTWVESRNWGMYNRFDSWTMPHRIVRTGVNEFTFAPIIWNERLVGDEDTAPQPSFIGGPINDVFFFRNRLGFLAKDNCILSRAGDYFNFWPKTALDVLDDDPIDVAVSGSDPSTVPTLRYARPFEDNLMLVSDQVQFSLSSGRSATLTPQTVVVDPTTHFVASADCAPVSAGTNLYFISPEAHYSRLREYFVQPDSLVTDAADVTGHVPNYLPFGPATMRTCNSLDVIFLHFQYDPNSIYVYKYYWQGNEKVQSAWCKWQFWQTILAMAVFDTTLYLVLYDTGAAQTRLVKLDLNKLYTGNLPFKVHLDGLVQVTGSFDSGSNKTTWTLPYSSSIPDGYWYVVDPDNGLPVNGVSKISDTMLQVSGDYSSKAYYIGAIYTMLYRFSEFFLRNSQGLPMIGGKLQIRTLTLSYEDTGYFRLEVTPEYRDKMTHEYNGIELGAASLGQPAIADGPQRFLIMAKSNKTILELVNDSYLPSSFQTANVEGYFVQRSRMA